MCSKRFEVLTQYLWFKDVHFKQQFFHVSWDGDIMLEMYLSTTHLLQQFIYVLTSVIIYSCFYSCFLCSQRALLTVFLIICFNFCLALV